FRRTSPFTPCAPVIAPTRICLSRAMSLPHQPHPCPRPQGAGDAVAIPCANLSLRRFGGRSFSRLFGRSRGGFGLGLGSSGGGFFSLGSFQLQAFLRLGARSGFLRRFAPLEFRAELGGFEE